MDKREKLLRGLDLAAMTGIEIGALASPIVSRAEGKIIYIDHADTGSLREKYATHAGVDIEQIVEVDAVWGSNTLQEAIGEDVKVDYVVASHVVEHVPDLLGWLAEIESVLRPAGTLRLAVPDRRFTFDYLRQETRLSDILNARLLEARQPLPAQILDHVMEVVALDANAAWRGEIDPNGGLRRLHSIHDAVSMARDTLRNGTYLDVHCWVFTPYSFARLFRRGVELELHRFACIDFYDTEPGDLEFQVILQPCGDKDAAVASWDRMARSVNVDIPLSAGSGARTHSADALNDLAALRAKVAIAERRVADMEASSSWRITGPVRALATSLRLARNRAAKTDIGIASPSYSPNGSAEEPSSHENRLEHPQMADLRGEPATAPGGRANAGAQPPVVALPDPGAQTPDPFGKNYFMNPACGSSYRVNNYLETALLSRTYFEMAEIIATCFRPRNVLEVGCAAGPMIYHLNGFFNTTAHGVDLSAWAVENRLHANISQSSADSLPFADATFDLVYSCHMLEHLTLDTFDKAIAEMTRVATPDAVQLHLLPILGSGPYTDVFGAMVGLRKDPTHNLLFNRARWLAAWARHGWQDSEVQVAHAYDNHSFEFSDCQILLVRAPLDLETCKRIARRNLDVGRTFQNALVRRPAPGLEVFLNDIRDNWK